MTSTLFILHTIFLSIYQSIYCSERENSYFGLARNLIRHLISPNQDDLSYSARDFFTGKKKLGKLPNPLPLAGERRPVQTSY